MAFTLKPDQPIRRELKRIGRKELRRAGACLRDDEERAVHTARKSVKKARAIVKLLTQADADSFAKDEKRLRTAGRALSELRDAAAVIATFDRLRKRFPKRLSEHTYAIVRRRLRLEKARFVSRAKTDGSVARVARRLRAVRRSAKKWRVPSIDRSGWAAWLETSFRASGKAMKTAMKTVGKRSHADDLHRWRKRVKTLWYHVRLSESLGPDIHLETRRLKQLETWLGENQDLQVLQTVMARDAGLRGMRKETRELTAMCAAVQEGLQHKAVALGRQVYAEKPKAFARRLRRAFTGSPRRSSSAA